MQFRNEYFFLSNFYPCTVTYGGIAFPTSEHAFVAAKLGNVFLTPDILLCATPGEVKRFGRLHPMRPDWDQVKADIMIDIVRAKFTQHDDLAYKLVETGDVELVEGNTWGDTTWGRVNGVGRNLLGIALMHVRAELRAAGSGWSSMRHDLIVLVTGGRQFEDRAFVYDRLDVIHLKRTIQLVLHGACTKFVVGDRDQEVQLRGADRWAQEWAISREVPYLGVPAPWKLLGRRAGMARNATMLNMRYVPHLVVGFPGGGGTEGMLKLAGDAKITRYVPTYPPRQ